MKKIIYFLIIGCLIFSGCSKEEPIDKEIQNQFPIALVRKNNNDENLTYLLIDLQKQTYSIYEMIVTIHEDETFTSSNNLVETFFLEEQQIYMLDSLVTESFTNKNNYEENDLKYGKGIDDIFYIVYEYKDFKNGLLDMDYKGVILNNNDIKDLFKGR